MDFHSACQAWTFTKLFVRVKVCLPVSLTSRSNPLLGEKSIGCWRNSTISGNRGSFISDLPVLAASDARVSNLVGACRQTNGNWTCRWWRVTGQLPLLQVRVRRSARIGRRRNKTEHKQFDAVLSSCFVRFTYIFDINKQIYTTW